MPSLFRPFFALALDSFANLGRPRPELSCSTLTNSTNSHYFFHFCRGKFRSKPWDSILEEARYLVSQGALELNLIAEDTNQWGQDRRDGRNLAHLLRALGEIEGLKWIRLLYCYPSYFNDELIDEIANNPKVKTPSNSSLCSAKSFPNNVYLILSFYD